MLLSNTSDFTHKLVITSHKIDKELFLLFDVIDVIIHSYSYYVQCLKLMSDIMSETPLFIFQCKQSKYINLNYITY
jgi:hypothetical protein